MTRGIQEWGLSKKARCYLFATCLVDWSWLACRQEVLLFFFFLINSFLALLYMPTLTLCACWIGLESVKLVYRPWKSSITIYQIQTLKLGLEKAKVFAQRRTFYQPLFIISLTNDISLTLREIFIPSPQSPYTECCEFYSRLENLTSHNKFKTFLWLLIRLTLFSPLVNFCFIVLFKSYSIYRPYTNCTFIVIKVKT